MTCRELTEFLGDYLSGELPPPQRKTFEEHLAACVDCRRYLASYETTIRLGKAAMRATDADVPAEVPEGLVQAVLASRKPPR